MFGSVNNLVLTSETYYWIETAQLLEIMPIFLEFAVLQKKSEFERAEWVRRQGTAL